MLEKVLKLACLSAPILKIVTPDKKFAVRAQLNVFMDSPLGSGKSLILRSIKSEDLGMILEDFTIPGLVGTLKKSGTLVRGTIFQNSGKVIMIDEFQDVPFEIRKVLLSLMEDQFYERSLGYTFEGGTYIEEKPHYFIQVRGTHLSFHSKSSYIVSTMKFERRRVEDIALISRCFPINQDLSIDEAIDLFLGKRTLSFSDVRKSLPLVNEAIVVIKDEQRQLLVKLLKEQIRKFKFSHPGFISRMLWDTMRIAAVFSCLDSRYEINKEDVLSASEFASYEMSGFAKVILSQRETDIYGHILDSKEGITPTELCSRYSLSENTVKCALDKLYVSHLVSKKQVGRDVLYYPIKLEDLLGDDRGDVNETKLT